MSNQELDKLAIERADYNVDAVFEGDKPVFVKGFKDAYMLLTNGEVQFKTPEEVLAEDWRMFPAHLIPAAALAIRNYNTNLIKENEVLKTHLREALIKLGYQPSELGITYDHMKEIFKKASLIKS